MAKVFKVFSVRSLAAVALMMRTARADTDDATCEDCKHGDEKRKLSGTCSFSQRQDYSDLRHGDTYSLSPGNKLERSKADGNSQGYKCENKIIVVTFSDTTAEQFGDTLRNRRDLVGQEPDRRKES